MTTRARRKPQRNSSIAVKLDSDVIAMAERLAAAARISFDTYLSHALRHYNRFHALTKHNRVRPMRAGKVVALFPALDTTVRRSASARRPRRRRNSR